MVLVSVAILLSLASFPWSDLKVFSDNTLPNKNIFFMLSQDQFFKAATFLACGTRVFAQYVGLPAYFELQTQHIFFVIASAIS